MQWSSRGRAGARRADGGPSTALEGVHRGLISTALLWQPLWLVAQSSLWPAAQPGPAPVVALGAVAIVWVWLLFVHLTGRSTRWAVRFSVVSLIMGALTMNVAQLRTSAPDIGSVAEMAGLAAGISGLLLSLRWGVVWTLALVTPLIRDAITVPDPWPDFPVLPAYVLALGLSAVAVRRALERNASAADQAADALYETQRERQTAEQVEHYLQETARRLHETVLNTLVAIGRGGIPEAGDGAGIRARCRESARLLTALRSRTEPAGSIWLTGDLAGDVASAAAQLRDLGVEIEWEVAASHAIPPNVYAALRSGVAEALLNVSRHAGARHVRVRSEVSRRGPQEGVRLEVVDDGSGFDPATTGSRFGIAEAILSPMVEVGGTATVTAQPGQGTCVILEWHPADSRPLDPVVRPAAVSVPLLGTAGLYVLTVVVVTWSTVARPSINALALLTFLGAAAALIGWTLRVRLPWGAVTVVAALGWVTYALQTAAAGAETSPEWSSSAVAVLFMVAAATGPRWSWGLLVLVWLGIQGDPLHELTQPGTAMILVGALLGRSTRRSAALANARRQDRQEADAARESARVRLDRLGRRYAALASSRAPELLLDLAEGKLSPHDPDVRAWAVREERFIRTVIAVDPAIDSLHALVDTCAQIAHHRGVLLDADLAAPSQPQMALPPAFVESCQWASSHAAVTVIAEGQPIGTTARISSRAEGGQIVVRALVPLASATDLADAPDPGDLVDPDDAAGPVVLWEAAWSSAHATGAVHA